MIALGSDHAGFSLKKRPPAPRDALSRPRLGQEGDLFIVSLAPRSDRSCPGRGASRLWLLLWWSWCPPFYQQTLNGGFRGMAAFVAIVALVGLLVLIPYKNNRPGHKNELEV